MEDTIETFDIACADCDVTLTLPDLADDDGCRTSSAFLWEFQHRDGGHHVGKQDLTGWHLSSQS